MANRPISEFFQRLGFPLRNIAWSWGAQNKTGVLLRTWEDEFDFSRKSVRVLRSSWRDLADSSGLPERIEHLRSLWTGDFAGYTVMVTTDPAHDERKIKDYRDDAVFPIDHLEVEADGTLVAVLGRPVPVQDLAEHSATHRTAAPAGPYPIA
jgi:hypothetical protein